MNRLAFASLLVLMAIGATCMANSDATSGTLDGMEGDPRPLSTRDDEWRHTRLGWERQTEWATAVAPNQPWLDLRPLHPALLGAMIGLVGVGALLVDEESRRNA